MSLLHSIRSAIIQAPMTAYIIALIWFLATVAWLAVARRRFENATAGGISRRNSRSGKKAALDGVIARYREVSGSPMTEQLDTV